MNAQLVTLDVRDDIRQGREPFSKIMSAVAALTDDQDLRLLAPFEPVPLFRVLERKGFAHHARPTDAGDWEVLFRRGPAAADAASPRSGAAPEAEAGGAERREVPAASGPAQVVEVDARGLEPPQPLATILEALAALPANATLRARTDRRPMHLHPQLPERGFVGESEEQSDGSFLTHIRRA